MSQTSKRILWVVGLVAFYLLAVYALPTPEGLSPQGKKAIILMVCAVATWVTEIIPLVVSTIFFIIAQAIVGVIGLGPAVANFAPPTILFVIASFFLAIGLQVSGMSNRIALRFVTWSKGDPKRVILYIMIAAGFVSMFVSDIPTSAAFLPIALTIIAQNNLKPGSNFGKSLLIAIPVAALIGGVGTPAGSSLNVLAMDTLRKVTNGQFDIKFLTWSSIGIPMVILLIPAAWLVITAVFPSEIKKFSGIEVIEKQYKELGSVKSNEVKFLIIFAIQLVLWLTDSLSNWGVPIETVLGTLLFFIPAIGFMDAKDLKDKIPLDVILIIGAGNSLGTSLATTGAAKWMGLGVVSGFAGASPLVLIAVIGLFVILIHLICPVNNAIVSFMVPALVAAAGAMGLSPMALVVPMTFCTACSFLLPLDPVPLVTFGSGYYKMTDYFKSGWVLSLVWIVIMMAVMLGIAKPMGMF